MKKNLFLLFLTISFCFVDAHPQTTPPPPQSDSQIWSDVQVIFPIVKRKDENNKEYDKATFFLNGTLRFGRNLRHFVDERLGFGFDFRINKYLVVTPSYLYRRAQPYQNRKESENRFKFAVGLEKKFKRFSIRNRNLIEHRVRSPQADSTRYRNRFYFIYPYLRGKKEIFTPFVTNEVFYDFSQKTFTRNEFSAGITRKFTDDFSADFYYLLQKNRGNVLRTVNAFGISLKVRVD